MWVWVWDVGVANQTNWYCGPHQDFGLGRKKAPWVTRDEITNKIMLELRDVVLGWTGLVAVRGGYALAALWGPKGVKMLWTACASAPSGAQGVAACSESRVVLSLLLLMVFQLATR